MVQPSAPGQRVVLRQAKASADWASTTVMNAAPDAAAIAAVSGHGVCGPHPCATIETTNAAIVATATVGPSTPNARRTTRRFISLPCTGGPSSRWALGGSAPSATADRVSVPMSRARICRTPSASGKRPPDSTHTTNGVSSATLSVRW